PAVLGLDVEHPALVPDVVVETEQRGGCLHDDRTMKKPEVEGCRARGPFGRGGLSTAQTSNGSGDYTAARVGRLGARRSAKRPEDHGRQRSNASASPARSAHSASASVSWLAQRAT